GYAKSEAMIPMRDGVKLRVVILAPRAAAPLPILLQRTPYNANGAIGLARRAKELGLEGYIIVFGDIRGRFGSEGTFDMNRPPRAGSQGVDESTDAYDTIDWLVKNVPNNNGMVGTFGVSYPGWLTAVTGIGPHPALRAPGVRLSVAGPRAAALYGPRDRADARGGRMVGPGGRVRSARPLRSARAHRHGAARAFGDGSMVPRTMVR